MGEVVNLDEYRKRLQREGAKARREGAGRGRAALPLERRKAKREGEGEAPTRSGRDPDDSGSAG